MPKRQKQSGNKKGNKAILLNLAYFNQININLKKIALYQLKVLQKLIIKILNY